MTSRSSFRYFALLAICIVLSSCGSAPPKPERLEIRIATSTDLNPDIEGRPSPAVLHILQLTDVDEFNRADYFALTRGDAATLGGDVLSKTEIVLTPGVSTETRMELHPQAAHLGFVAGFRDIDNARWRLAQAVVPGKTDWISVSLDRLIISIIEVHD